MTLALDAVVKQLTDSGIVAQGKLENFVPPKAHPKNAEELVTELVKQNCLTKFQAQAVAAGKAKSLILGGYTLLDRIGAGGMGQVFKAYHRRMERTVAIKMLPPAMTKDAAALARFQREVIAAAKLLHTHIVAAFDSDQAGNAHFLVMEYVEGSDLSALVKKGGTLSVEKAVSYILQAARGLEFAHSEGVIHRDIKPANLLVDKKGTVKILDMGLARISTDGNAAAQAELTGTGAVMGTVDYMAPEQAKATRHADARADIYSLGCTLYYLLVGGPIYGGETLIEKLLAHQGNPIPELRNQRPDVPEQLEVVYHRMVAKDLADRYQTMSEVIADLSSVLSSPLGGERSAVIGDSGSLGSNSNLSFLKEETGKTLHRKGTKSTKAYVSAKASGGGRSNKPLLIGGGLLAAVLLAAIIVVSMRKHDTAPIGSTETPNAAAPPLAKAPFDAKQARAHQDAWARHLGTEVETPNIVGMKMVLIPPGEFLMGSTDDEVAAALKVAEEIHADQRTKDRILKAERPQHKVVITKPFWMSATEVTVGQFKKFSATGYLTEGEKAGSGGNYLQPGYPITDDSPVARITWNDATEYCRWLSGQEKRTYRLPSEAEWEYACRAGTTTNYHFGDDSNQLSQYGWHHKNANDAARIVGTRLPNPFGLFDMHGNLWEWCGDFWDEKWYENSPTNDPFATGAGNQHALRGSTWTDMDVASLYGRCAYRHSNQGPARVENGGFRCVSELSAPVRSVSPTPTAPIQSSSKLFMHDPAFPAWLKEVQVLPAEDQVKAVIKKLMELKPGFDGNETHTIVANVVTSLSITSQQIVDISPVRALTGLTTFSCAPPLANAVAGRLRDLTPLQGMKLSSLNLRGNPVTEFSPLQGMPLTSLTCSFTHVSDLTPLTGMPLTRLVCFDSPVANLAPLKGMSLDHLDVTRTQVSDLTPIAGMPLKTLNFVGTRVHDLSPLRGMRLTTLNCDHTPISDLTPLHDSLITSLPIHGTNVSDLRPIAGLKLTKISCYDSRVSDLTPLRGMPLTSVDVTRTGVADLSPLVGMKLTTLNFVGTPIKDLSPVKGMPLTTVAGDESAVTDLTPLDDCLTLKTLSLGKSKVPEASIEAFRRAHPGCTVKWTSQESATPAKAGSAAAGESTKLFMHDPAFPAWIKEVQALPAEEQIKAVSKKLMELNPGFDGKLEGTSGRATPPIENGVVTSLRLITDHVTDISPLRAFVGLKNLISDASGWDKGRLSDLSPLAGMKLTNFICNATLVSDLSPLQGMELTRLQCIDVPITDLSPLINMPLRDLNCCQTKVVDLSPLRGLPLVYLNCSYTQVSDLSPLESAKSLIALEIGKTRVTAAAVDALQKALPGCKINWDDPTKTPAK